jgi:hypothetical protein
LDVGGEFMQRIAAKDRLLRSFGDKIHNPTLASSHLQGLRRPRLENQAVILTLPG